MKLRKRIIKRKKRRGRQWIQMEKQVIVNWRKNYNNSNKK